MSGMTTTNSDLLIRAELWSNSLKDTLQDELDAQRHVNWIDFPDGNTWTIPSIGDSDVQDYVEDTAVEYTPMDVGEFQFSITNYIQAGTYITAKNRQDAFYAAQLEASFLPKQARAISVRMETDILNQGQPGTPNGQTSGNLNNINGAAHRWVGGDTANSKRTLGVKDFAKVRHSLKKANVPDSNIIGIVDPSVAYHMNTLTGLSDLTYNPRWEGIVASGIDSGMTFKFNIYGIDVYESNYLPTVTASETIATVASGSDAVCNLFFSAANGMDKPWIGSLRQAPKVDSEWNKDFQREEYVTTARWGVKLYRPENFITVLASPDVIV